MSGRFSKRKTGLFQKKNRTQPWFVSVKNKTTRCPHCIRKASTHRNEYNERIEMRLFILQNLQLEIINFLYKNLRKAECWLQCCQNIQMNQLLTKTGKPKNEIESEDIL